MDSAAVLRSFVASAGNKKRFRVRVPLALGKSHWHWERATGTGKEEIVRTYFKKFFNGLEFYDIFYSIVFIESLHRKGVTFLMFTYFGSRKKRLESWSP